MFSNINVWIILELKVVCKLTEGRLRTLLAAGTMFEGSMTLHDWVTSLTF